MVALINHRAEWDEIDRAAEREGIAVTRLQRRTGYAPASPAELHNRHPDAGRHVRYNRLAAVDAFARLFRDGAGPRRQLYATRGDRQRRQLAATRRAADVAIGTALRGLAPERAREVFQAIRAGERIDGAAVRWAGRVYTGNAHFVAWGAVPDPGWPAAPTEQLEAAEGFTTTTGRFLDRNEAAIVAKSAQQLDDAKYRRDGHRLICEDLRATG